MDPHGRRHPSPAVPVRFLVPTRAESLPVLRALITTLGDQQDLGVDAVVALRLAIDEACTALIGAAVPGSGLVVAVDPGQHDVRVRLWASCLGEDVLAPGTFSWHVISSLTQDLATFRGPNSAGRGELFGITMTAKRSGASPP